MVFISDEISTIINELNILGYDAWEIISYDEIKPKKFGDRYVVTIIIKRLKPA